MADSIEPINAVSPSPLNSAGVTDALIILEHLNPIETSNNNVISNSEVINKSILEDEIIQNINPSSDASAPGTSHASILSQHVANRINCNHMQELRDVVALEHMIENENEMRDFAVYEELEEVDDYDEEEDQDQNENDELEEDEIAISAILPNGIATLSSAEIPPPPTPNSVSVSATAAIHTSGSTRNIGMTDHDMRRAFSELFLVSDNGIAVSNQGNLMGSSLATGLSPSSSLSSVSSGTLHETSIRNITSEGSEVKALTKKSPLALAPTPYNRLEFLSKLQENGVKSPLDIIVTDNFTLPLNDIDALFENLDWMYGSIDDFFQLPKLHMEKLEYLCMIKFTAGDYVLHKTGGKCRDRESILEHKPMEVLYLHYVYFMALVVLEKIPRAHQVLMEMKASTSYANIASNSGRWNKVFEFLQNNLGVFFNFVTGRHVFKNDTVVPSVDDWDQDQRWYLSLACFMGSKAILKPIKLDIEAVFVVMVNYNMFNVEWGLFMVDELEACTHLKKNRIKLLKARIVQALMKENDVCRNPYSILCHTRFLIDQQSEIKDPVVFESLNMSFRNVLNKYGEIVQVRLEVASQLEKLPIFPGRANLMKYTIVKAVEINSAHPEANYRLAMHYDSARTSGIVLSLRYLKASIVVDSSNFVAVMEYCKILMGKHFRLMSAAFGNTSVAVAVEQPNGEVVNTNTRPGVDVPGIIQGFTTGIGAKFWTSDQISELKLLMFYALVMTGAEEDALEVLLPIYRNNKIIYALKNVDKMREKYGWSSTYVTRRQLINIFTETYEAILEEEGTEEEPEPIEEPEPSIVSVTKRSTDEQLKSMLTFLLSYLHKEFS